MKDCPPGVNVEDHIATQINSMQQIKEKVIKISAKQSEEHKRYHEVHDVLQKELVAVRNICSHLVKMHHSGSQDCDAYDDCNICGKIL